MVVRAAFWVPFRKIKQPMPKPSTERVINQALSEADVTLWLPGQVPLLLRRIDPGTFRMGSRSAYPNEEPVHRVRITEPYCVGTFPVTQAQYCAVAACAPELQLNPESSDFKGESRPVEQVSWEDAVAWCGWIERHWRDLNGTTREGTELVIRSFGLLTEAQWEFACRMTLRRTSYSAPSISGSTFSPSRTKRWTVRSKQRISIPSSGLKCTLRGRNAKTHWLEAWSEKPESKQAEEALSSIFLTQAKDQYAFGFRENLNHFYSGLNALGLLTVITELSAKYPRVWELQFDSAEEAAQRLGELNVERKRLSATVESSLAACQEKTKRGGERDMWLEISLADFRCLTATNPPRVAQAYRQALAEGDAFAIDSVRAQLLIYQQLGVKGENAAAALAIAEFGTAKPETELLHVFLFTGHQIDSPDRPSPRFPADREPVARAKIKEVLEAELAVLKGQTLGIADAASGGDILFLEVCAQVGITTDVYLALPANAFINESVAPAGGNWVTRFRTLMAKQEEKAKQAKKEIQPPLADKKKMPIWLQAKENYDIWQRNNLWMLHHALHRGGRNTTLIALWDGGGGDGPGGTKDMITQARALGARTIIIDTRKEFGL
jgi:Sulfatase-modifying factor enzyme 1